MSKITSIAAGMAVVPMLAFSIPALADGNPGQIEMGDIYRVKNSTTNSGFAASGVTAQCGNTVEFRVRIHNGGPESLTNVKVAATLDGTNSTSHGSKATLSADNNLHSANVTANAGFTTDKATTLSYVSGSTQLLGYGSNGNEPVLKTLPDGIVGGSVNIGNVGPTTPDTEEVQFQAKLNCVTTPVTPPTTPTTPATPVAPTTPGQPTTLVNTGAGSVAGIFAAVTAAAVVASQVVLRRRQTRTDSN